MVAAIIYLAGLMVLFGVRTRQHRRATGSSGFNGFTRRDKWARTAGALFAVAVIAGASALVLTAAGSVPVLASSDLMQPLAVVGLFLTAAGLVLAWVAQSAMGASWRIGVDPTETTALVTDGLFRFMRNPIFTAMAAAQAGTVLMAPSWLSLLALVALVVAIQLQVRRVEEPYLAVTHGSEYRDYSARVGRFLPLLGRQHMPTGVRRWRSTAIHTRRPGAGPGAG